MGQTSAVNTSLLYNSKIAHFLHLINVKSKEVFFDFFPICFSHIFVVD